MHEAASKKKNQPPPPRVVFDALAGRDRDPQRPSASGHDTDLRWTLLLDDPLPDEDPLRAMRYRMNQLINTNLRHSFGQ